MDWVALAGKSISIPVNILSRYAQAGIQPYTVEFCQTIGRAFDRRISQEKLDACEKRLNRSKLIGLSCKFLYVGTGISVIPRQLAATRGGVAFAAFVTILRSGFGSSYCGRVLHELTTHLCPEDVSVPTNGQFEVLCEEIVANGVDRAFLDIQHIISKLLWDGVTNNGNSSIHHGPDTPHADDMAITILALLSVDRGKSLIIEGRPGLLS